MSLPRIIRSVTFQRLGGGEEVKTKKKKVLNKKVLNQKLSNPRDPKIFGKGSHARCAMNMEISESQHFLSCLDCR